MRIVGTCLIALSVALLASCDEELLEPTGQSGSPQPLSVSGESRVSEANVETNLEQVRTLLAAGKMEDAHRAYATWLDVLVRAECRETATLAQLEQGLEALLVGRTGVDDSTLGSFMRVGSLYEQASNLEAAARVYRRLLDVVDTSPADATPAATAALRVRYNVCEQLARLALLKEKLAALRQGPGVTPGGSEDDAARDASLLKLGESFAVLSRELQYSRLECRGDEGLSRELSCHLADALLCRAASSLLATRDFGDEILFSLRDIREELGDVAPAVAKRVFSGRLPTGLETLVTATLDSRTGMSVAVSSTLMMRPTPDWLRVILAEAALNSFLHPLERSVRSRHDKRALIDFYLAAAGRYRQVRTTTGKSLTTDSALALRQLGREASRLMQARFRAAGIGEPAVSASRQLTECISEYSQLGGHDIASEFLFDDAGQGAGAHREVSLTGEAIDSVPLSPILGAEPHCLALLEQFSDECASFKRFSMAMHEAQTHPESPKTVILPLKPPRDSTFSRVDWDSAIESRSREILLELLQGFLAPDQADSRILAIENTFKWQSKTTRLGAGFVAPGAALALGYVVATVSDQPTGADLTGDGKSDSVSPSFVAAAHELIHMFDRYWSLPWYIGDSGAESKEVRALIEFQQNMRTISWLDRVYQEVTGSSQPIATPSVVLRWTGQGDRELSVEMGRLAREVRRLVPQHEGDWGLALTSDKWRVFLEAGEITW